MSDADARSHLTGCSYTLAGCQCLECRGSVGLLRFLSGTAFAPKGVMPLRPCPSCHAHTARLLEATSQEAIVWYVRCYECGHVWTVCGEDPVGDVTGRARLSRLPIRKLTAWVSSRQTVSVVEPQPDVRPRK